MLEIKNMFLSCAEQGWVEQNAFPNWAYMEKKSSNSSYLMIDKNAAPYINLIYTMKIICSIWYVIVHSKERHQQIQSDKTSTDLRFISLWQMEITNGRIKTYLTCQDKNALFYHLSKQWHISIMLIV